MKKKTKTESENGFNKRFLRFVDNLDSGQTLGKIIVVFSIIGLILYGNTFINQLFWDDNESIVNNQYIRSWEHFPSYFSENLTAGAGVRDNYWRPLLLFSFSLDYKIGGLTPFFYHFQNLFWHVLSAILVYVVILKLFKNLLFFRRKIFEKKIYEKMVAFLTALVFLIHPLQTEAVTYVAGRADPMHSALMLLSFLFFLKFADRLKHFSQETKKGELRLKYLIWSVVFFALSLMTKERAIILPGIIFAYLLLFYGKTIFDRWKEKIFLFLPYFLLALACLILRSSVLHFADTFDLGAEDNLGAPGFFDKFLVVMKGFAIYQWLLIWPVKLFMEKRISVPQGFFEPLVLVGFATLVIWIGAIFYFWKRKRIISFGILWFFIALSPSIHVFPIQGLLYEHWLYFPMIGLWLSIFVFVFAFFVSRNNHKLNKFLIVLLLSWLIFLSFRTIIRNNDWRDPVRFYEKNISLGGKSARVYTNLGMGYSDQKQYERAIDSYNKAIELEREIFPPWYNLGNVYRDLGDFEKAIENYEKSIEINDQFPPVYMNIAMIHVQEKKNEKAIDVLKKALEINPNNIQIVYNIGMIYLELGDKENAKKYVGMASDLDPRNMELLEVLWGIK
jgi:protein O-mannosyl-transferase